MHRAIEAIWRIEAAKVIAGLARMVRDIGIAEDLAQDALVAALEQWPREGVPPKPGAWLMTTAKHRALDWLRRNQMMDRKHEDLAYEMQLRESSVPDIHAEDDEIDDDLLRLIFVACHPALPEEARVALTLRLLGGLTTGEIARAYLLSEATLAQRIVRAKRILAQRRVPFEVPTGTELKDRLSSVLGVIYLIFNEGYAATVGDRWIRPDLCQEALRLGRILAQLMPSESEVHALLALMELQASRFKARVNGEGEPVLLLEQNRSHWDHLLIDRGLRGLELVEKLGGAEGIYALQAAIAACHARARLAEQTDWARIAELYRSLMEVAPSPVVQLNQAMALGMAEGPAAGLAIVEEIASEASLANYHRLSSVRGDLLFRLGRFTEARAEFERAASLTQNARERQLLLSRADSCAERGETAAGGPVVH